LTGLRDQLKAGLSASSHQADKEEGPSAAELAEQIKALKAANSIEGTPQRARQKHSTAEEPITARIRRRTGSTDDSGTSAMSGGFASSTNTYGRADRENPTENGQSKSIAHANGQAGATQESSGKPMTFQERLAIERHHKGREPILS
jgi:hypothetical protein